MKDELIIVFDGTCNFCNSTVQFIIKRDAQSKFKFTAIQCKIGYELLQKYELNSDKINTIVLFKSGFVYMRSDAALQISKELGMPWKIFVIFKIFPKYIRDFLYDVLAKHRYDWFGKRDKCFIPTPELKQRFLE